MKVNIKSLLLKAAFVAVLTGGVAAGAEGVSATSVVEFDRGTSDPNNRPGREMILETEKKLEKSYETIQERLN